MGVRETYAKRTRWDTRTTSRIVGWIDQVLNTPAKVAEIVPDDFGDMDEAMEHRARMRSDLIFGQMPPKKSVDPYREQPIDWKTLYRQSQESNASLQKKVNTLIFGQFVWWMGFLILVIGSASRC